MSLIYDQTYLRLLWGTLLCFSLQSPLPPNWSPLSAKQHNCFKLTHSLPKLPPYRAIDSRYSQLSTRQSLLIPLMVPSQTAQLSLQFRALLYDWVLPPPRQNAQLSFQYVCPTGHPHCFWEQQALHPQRKTSLSALTSFLAHLFKKPGDEVYVTNQLLNTDFLSHEIPGFFLSTGRRWIPAHKEGGSSHGNSYRNTEQILIYLLV